MIKMYKTSYADKQADMLRHITIALHALKRDEATSLEEAQPYLSAINTIKEVYHANA